MRVVLILFMGFPFPLDYFAGVNRNLPWVCKGEEPGLPRTLPGPN